MRVPIIEQDRRLQGIGAPRLSAGMSAPDNSGMENLTRAVSGVIDQGIKDNNEDVLFKAQGALDAWENKTLFDPEQGAFAKNGADALKLETPVMAGFDELSNGLSETMSPVQKRAFAQVAASRRDSVLKRLNSHIANQRKAWDSEQTAALYESNAQRAALNFSDPSIVSSALEHARDAAIVEGMKAGSPANAVDQAVKARQSKILLGVMGRMADVDPQGALDFYEKNRGSMTSDALATAWNIAEPLRKKLRVVSLSDKGFAAAAGAGDREGIIRFVMHDLEGGSKTVPDGAGVSKYGIHGPSHGLSDFTVATLTEEQAAQIYREKYWDGMKIDELPESMRLPVYDAAVNQGPGAARDMLEKSGMDVEKFMALREERYRETAKNPDKAANLPGWLNRLDALRARMADPGEMSESRGVLAIREAADSEEEADLAISRMRARTQEIENARKERDAAFLERALGAVQQSGYDWTQLPVDDLAYARRRGLLDKIQKYDGTSDPKVENALAVLSSDALAAVDLRALAPSLSQGDYKKYRDAQTRLRADPQAAGIRDRIIKAAKFRMEAAGIDPTPSPDKPAKAQETLDFINAVQREVDSYGSKPVTPADLDRIIDRNLIEGRFRAPNASWYQTDRSGRQFTARPGEVFYADPPASLQPVLLKMADRDLVSIAQKYPSWVRPDGSGLSPDGMVKYYTALRQSGLSDDDIARAGP